MLTSMVAYVVAHSLTAQGCWCGRTG